ncbi:MAG: PD40 domain-containing protein [Nitrospirae bacterium]|nr:PD40 domain-containing protein [Nitrospirota bacterium]
MPSMIRPLPSVSRPVPFPAGLLVAAGLAVFATGCAGWFHRSSAPSSPYDLVVTHDRRLTSKPAIMELPNSWSPDGSRLAATIMDRSDIYIEIINAKNGDADRRRLLPPSSFHDYYAIWSPDGRRLVFFSDRSGNFDIWTVNSDGSDLKRLTDDAADDVYGYWSPDGTKIAFLSTRSREMAIWVMNSDGTGQHQVTAGGNGDWGVSWSPTGKQITFGSIRTSALNQPKPNVTDTLPPSFKNLLTLGIPSQAIWTVDVDTRLLKQLTTGTESHWHPMWSPDGMKIAYVSGADKAGSRHDGGMDIWVMDNDGTHPQPLTSGPRYEAFPVWSPDGRQLAYEIVNPEDGSANIRILTLKKERRRP